MLIQTRILIFIILLIFSVQGGKAKGVENLIQVENPNRIQRKTKKLSQLNQALDTAKPELSRRERYVCQKITKINFLISIPLFLANYNLLSNALKYKDSSEIKK